MDRNYEIYDRYKKGESVIALASIYGISKSRVYAIIERERYQNDPTRQSELYSEFVKFTTPTNAVRFSLALERSGIYDIDKLYSLDRFELLSVWGISGHAIEIINQMRVRNGLQEV